GNVREARVVEQETERLQTDPALADVLVAVEVAAELPLRIVEVEGSDLADADRAGERCEGLLVSGGRAQVVPRREDMARIEADADPLRLADARQDVPDLLEASADGGPLSRPHFQQDARRGERPLRERLVERGRDPRAARLEPRADLRTGG